VPWTVPRGDSGRGRGPGTGAAGLPAGLSALVLQSQAVFTVVFAAVLLGDRPGPRRVAGLALSGAGIALIASRLGLDRPLGAFALVVAALALAGAVACRVGRDGSHDENQAAGEVSAAPSDTNPMSALRAMGGYLRDLKTFRVDVDATKDEPLDDGENLQFAGTVRYTVRTPDAMRVELRTDRKQRDYLYNGKQLTVYAPRTGYYATVAAPSTIREMLDTAVARYDLEFPVADLFLWGTDRADLDSIQASAYVGPANIRGRDCDHFAYRQADVDWQLWIERGSRPLPCKLVITTKSLPTRPEYTAVLTWDLKPSIDPSSFAFAPPDDAHPIKLRDWTDTTAGRGK